MKRSLAFVCLLAVAAPGTAADTLGRLFYTPAQRAQLDNARTHRSPAPVAEVTTEEAPGPSALTYGGIVRRSDGKSTLWINDRVVTDTQALSGATVVGQVRPDGALRLQLPQDRRAVDLKVGQTLEIESGSVAENYVRVPSAKHGTHISEPNTSAREPDRHESLYSSMKRRFAAGRDAAGMRDGDRGTTGEEAAGAAR